MRRQAQAACHLHPSRTQPHTHETGNGDALTTSACIPACISHGHRATHHRHHTGGPSARLLPRNSPASWLLASYAWAAVELPQRPDLPRTHRQPLAEVALLRALRGELLELRRPLLGVLRRLLQLLPHLGQVLPQVGLLLPGQHAVGAGCALSAGRAFLSVERGEGCSRRPGEFRLEQLHLSRVHHPRPAARRAHSRLHSDRRRRRRRSSVGRADMSALHGPAAEAPPTHGHDSTEAPLKIFKHTVVEELSPSSRAAPGEACARPLRVSFPWRAQAPHSQEIPSPPTTAARTTNEFGAHRHAPPLGWGVRDGHAGGGEGTLQLHDAGLALLQLLA
jgi:hypothetical protein